MARPFLAIAAVVALTIALTAPTGAVPPPLKQPKWTELSPQQREILAPLSVDWNKLDSFRKKKWIGIAQRYPSLSPKEQQRLQHRMQAWAKLTPGERTRAREQYKNLKKEPPAQRQAIKEKWQEYVVLPDAEKERLKQSAKRKPTAKTAIGKGRPSAAVVAPAVPAPASLPVPVPALVPAPAPVPAPVPVQQ